MTKIMRVFFIVLLHCICGLDCCSQIADKEQNLLYGKWIASEYVDSTVTNKSIYEYSRGFASTAYALEIDTSFNCYMKGFHEECDVPMIEWNEESAQFSFDAEQIWHVELVNKDMLKLFMTYRGKTSKPEYFRRSMDDLSSDISEYFMKEIFSGDYLNLGNNKMVHISDCGEVDNLDSIKKCEIVVDFWDNPVGDFDMIYLQKTNSYNIEYLYNWSFKADTLFINFLDITVDDDSGFYQGIVNKLAYKLLKKD